MSYKPMKEERPGTMFGVPGRFFAVIENPGGEKWSRAGQIVNQTWRASRPYNAQGYKPGSRITVELRFDDNCKNGHETFSATAEIKEPRTRDISAGGCLHEEIAKTFPELSGLLRWHLCSTDGPMHYEATTVYLAGDRDCWGCLKGEPRGWGQAVSFGDNPIQHKLRDSFAEFLKGAGPGFDFEVLAIEHDQRGAPDRHQFAAKYTFGGYADKWYECPFDTEAEALAFLEALQRCGPVFHKVPTAWGTGKVRELRAARDAAIWPGATDAQLCVEPDELRAALAARLPGLLAEFKRDMEAAGFLWPEPIEG
jgi:hypothetical protein